MDEPALGDLFPLSPAGGRGQAVFDAIRRALRAGYLTPGTPLREEKVAAWFEVSRTPVREAFARLAGQSILEHAGGRGMVVRTLRRSELFELYAMREVLEGAAAALAATHAATAEIAALDALQQRFAALPVGAAEDAARINQAFHDAIRETARNRYLDSSMDELADGIALLGTTTLRDPSRHVSAIAEHAAVVSAIRGKNPAAAEAAARAHIRAAFAARSVTLA